MIIQLLTGNDIIIEFRINSYIHVLKCYFIISVLELQTTSETTELTKHSFTPLYVYIAVIILSGLLNVIIIVRLVQT